MMRVFDEKKLTSPAVVRIIVVLAVFGTSFSAIFVRFGTASSMTLAFLRMAITTLLLLPSILKSCTSELAATTKKTLLLYILGGVALGFHFLTYFESVKNTTLASSLVLVNTEVFFVAIFLFIVYREKLAPLSILGVIMAFAGGATVAGGDFAFSREDMFGNIMALISAVCLSIYTLSGREARKTVSAKLFSFAVYLGAAVTLGTMMLISGESLLAITWKDIVAAFGMAVFCTLLGHSLNIWALKYVPTPYVSTAKLLEPVFASILGIFLYAEIPALYQIIGGAVLIGGVAVYGIDSYKREKKVFGK